MPDHPYEQLGDQRFQELAQALLADTYRDLQCLPVAQPDGGRDALIRVGPGDTMVFQVKFARQPDRLKDPEKWVIDVVNGELPKIRSLVSRGASRYKLVTNLSATAHLDRGSLDRVQKTLDRLLPIPAECWWRDDLNRRLDRLFDLKLAYPELFTGQDFLRLLVQPGRSDPEAARMERAVMSYLADQYEREREVRFKQVELSNDLLGVFIDVPAAPEVSEISDWNSPRAQLVETVNSIRQSRPVGLRLDELRDPLSGASAGAGSLILDSRFQAQAPRVIIEGAPGQGKSTMLQYVCQVHRLRILDRPEAKGLEPSHANSPVRLPLKVDLRDLAQWLTGRDAMSGEEVPAPLRSLEGFLSGQITAASGGAKFDVADLHATLSRSRVLLALDGLDEVVDITDRSAVIEAIVSGVNRLDPVAASLQVVVTSRPASFVGATSLPDELFQQMRLQSISRRLIDDYAEKWMVVRELDKRERAEMTKILDAKLKQPHIRDLAHNPMQLAILLNLVHRRGKALPDQRTALYSSYMETFLDREADKSEAVRDHRDLLMTLHGYLAWLLHCQAEQSGEAGRFETDRIEELVSSFLRSKGQNPKLFGNLFAGVFDRVGALVSRVQDTYEFEVQPLREFFAARYLYQTAPHAPAGEPCAGTRPERFDAMVRHPSWLNVVRFYAGSYDIGELASLADGLIQLRADATWGYTAHPRMVSAQLLADWTFQQELGVQGRVVTPLAKDLKGRGSVGDHNEPFAGLRPTLTVPRECGGAKIADEALKLLRKERRWDRRAALAEVIKAQIPEPGDRKKLWKQGLEDLKGAERDAWIKSSYSLGLRGVLRPEDFGDLDGLRHSTLEAILYAEIFAVFDDGGRRAEKAIEAVLDQPEAGQAGALDEPHPLPELSDALRVDWSLSFDSGFRRLRRVGSENSSSSRCGFEDVERFLAIAGRLARDTPPELWKRSLRPWSQLVGAGRQIFGDRPSLTDLAIVAAGVPDRKDRGRGHGQLFDTETDLCRRARHARLRTGDVGWWERMLAAADGEDDRVLALALCWLWASEPTLTSLLTPMEEILSELDSAALSRLVSVIQRALRLTDAKPTELRSIELPEGDNSPAVFACICKRMPEDLAIDALEKGNFARHEPTSGEVLTTIWDYEKAILAKQPERWADKIKSIASHYSLLDWFPEIGSGVHGFGAVPEMPLEVARAVVGKADRYPVSLVAMAERACMTAAQAALTNVGAIAQRDGWFDTA